MIELQRGKYELPPTWSIDNPEWIVEYDTIEKGKAVTKQLPLHPNCVNKAKVGEPCTFHIQNAPNLHNGGEWEDFAVVGNTDVLRVNNHMFDQIMAKSRLSIPSPPSLGIDKLVTELSQVAKTTKQYTEEEVKGILQETLKRLRNGK
jgi:hypothetical protein